MSNERFDFKCKCTLRERGVGDGCGICNTEFLIDLCPQPEELADELKNSGFSDDQASYIASDVYQPLMALIAILNDKIEQLRSAT